jgi:carbamoyl-phosphate synthase small subunit
MAAAVWRSVATVVGRRSLATVAAARALSPARVELANGAVFEGYAFGAPRSVAGEVVFSTGLVGYPESMSDPSYRGQILVFTQPLIGNYGVPSAAAKDAFGLPKYFESDRIQVSGIVVADAALAYSHWNAVESLASWCARHDVPAITGVDTRALTKLLRDRGSTLGRLRAHDGEAVAFDNPNQRNLVAEVSTRTVYELNPGGDVTVAVIDCGVKTNILRCLAERGARVVVVPWDHDLRHLAYDGLLVSNGPGDPTTCAPTVRQLANVAFQRPQPVFGICMGNLLMGMAAGASSYKLRFGNRGHNQPALYHATGKAVITSQNHGYAIDVRSLSSSWRPLFTNLNDGSNEGLMHTARPYTSVQFHPEYKGGPEDTSFLFDSFLASVRQVKAQLQQPRAVRAATAYVDDTPATATAAAVVG